MQTVKRSPLDLRPVLGIRPDDDPASLAWVLAAHCAAEFVAPDVRSRQIDALVARILELRSPAYEEPCWGYHYDMQSRVFFYPKGDPNVIATTFVGQALMDVHDLRGGGDLLEVIHGIGRFHIRHVPQTPDAPEHSLATS